MSVKKDVVQSAAVHTVAPMPNLHDVGASISRHISPDLHTVHGIVGATLSWMGSAASLVGEHGEKTHKVLSPMHDAVEIGGEIAKLAEKAGHSADAAKALKMAPMHCRSMVQMGHDIARIKRDILIYEKLVEHRGTQRAAALLPRMKSSLLAAESEWQRERSLWNGYRRISDKYGKITPTNIGKIALGVENTLGKSIIGRGLLQSGRFIEEGFRHVAGGIAALGACVALVNGVKTSPAQTFAGKVADGALSGGASLMVQKNPYVGAMDFAIEHTVGDDFKIEKFYLGSVHSVTAFTEGFIRSDTVALSKAHEMSMRGDNGALIQGVAYIGDRISKSTFGDSVITYAADFVKGVPREYRGSGKWWNSASGK